MATDAATLEPGFAITMRKGFHMRFENGWTASVQFGPGNYGTNYAEPFEGRRERDWDATTAEIAAFQTNGGEWYDFGEDTVAGYKSPAEVLAFLNMVAAL